MCMLYVWHSLSEILDSGSSTQRCQDQSPDKVAKGKVWVGCCPAGLAHSHLPAALREHRPAILWHQADSTLHGRLQTLQTAACAPSHQDGTEAGGHITRLVMQHAAGMFQFGE